MSRQKTVRLDEEASQALGRLMKKHRRHSENTIFLEAVIEKAERDCPAKASDKKGDEQ